MEWFGKTIDRIRYSVSRDKCYDLMYEQDVATKLGCPGINGGDKSTGYMKDRCVKCQHLVENGGCKNE